MSSLAWLLPASLRIECILSSVFKILPLKFKNSYFFNTANCPWASDISNVAQSLLSAENNSTEIRWNCKILHLTPHSSQTFPRGATSRMGCPAFLVKPSYTTGHPPRAACLSHQPVPLPDLLIKGPASLPQASVDS